MKPLSKPSKFLLRLLNNRFPLGIASTTPIEGATFGEQPSMIHMRGLIRRGFARESINAPGLFFITREGGKVAYELFPEDWKVK